jgi:putative flippase GtrA
MGLQMTLSDEFKRLGIFGLIGIFATGTHLAVAHIAFWISEKAILATGFGFVPALFLSYALHSRYTFRDAKGGSMLRYAGGSFSGLCFSVIILNSLENLAPNIGLTLSIVVIPFWTFLLSRFWAFNY